MGTHIRSKIRRPVWVVVMGLAVLMLLVFGRHAAPGPDYAALQKAVSAPVSAVGALSARRVEPDHSSLPATPVAPHPSLVGTTVNGGIRLKDGHVELTRDMRRMFDYYLSLRGRKSDAEIRALLQEHLKNSAVSAGSAEALAMFDKYIDLLDSESKMMDQWSQRDMKAPDQVAAVLEERRNLRREHLGDAMAEAFYADQENYEAYQLERLKISNDKSLTAEQKAAAMADAETLLTPEQREIRKQTFAWLDIKQAARQPVESLDAGSAEAIRQRFGENALDRLAVAEKERASWDEKRKAWLAEKASIDARTDLTPEQKKASLKEYAESHLDRGEQRRMEALDSDQAM